MVYFLNAVGDLIDLQHYLNPSGRPDFQSMTYQDILGYVNSQGHCSALVKVCFSLRLIVRIVHLYNEIQ